MLGAIDVDPRPQHGAVADPHGRGVEDDATSIEIDLVAECDIETVGAMEGCFQEDAVA